MSRAAAASSSTTPSNTPLYLVKQEQVDGSSSAVVRSAPFGEKSYPTDFGALTILASLWQQSDEAKARIERRKKCLEDEKQKRHKKFSDMTTFTSHGGGVFKISFVAWIRVLDYLLCENTRAFINTQLADQAQHSKFLIEDGFDSAAYFNRVQPLELALQSAVSNSRGTATTCFFSPGYQYDYESTCLLNAALNADLNTVKYIVENSNPDKLRRLLSAKYGTGKAITTLGRVTVERTGTPLQMAIYAHDEEMVGYLKNHMDSTEFTRQSKDAFATALTHEERAKLEQQDASALAYHRAMKDAQRGDAEALCAGLKDVFQATSDNQFSCDARDVASTSSEELQKAVDDFINRLKDYVKRNPVHNHEILSLVYSIYNYKCMPNSYVRDPHTRPYSEHACSFFYQKVIGGVQSLLPARWVQHYAQGVDYYGPSQRCNLVASRDFSFFDVNGNRADLRDLITSSVGVDSFMSIFAGGRHRVIVRGGHEDGIYRDDYGFHCPELRLRLWNRRFRNLFEAKTKKLEQYFIEQLEHKPVESKNEIGCLSACVIQ